jgi:hypothetical protein
MQKKTGIPANAVTGGLLKPFVILQFGTIRLVIMRVTPTLARKGEAMQGSHIRDLLFL